MKSCESVKFYDVIKWDDNPQGWINEYSDWPINSLLFYLLVNCSEKTISIPNEYWKDLSKFIEPDTYGAGPLIRSFPIPELCGDSSLFNDEGLVYEYDNFSTPVNLNNPTLYDWIKWCARYKEKNGCELEIHKFYDPRLSEWFALNIVRYIASLYNRSTTPEQYFGLVNQTPLPSIHPANFSIPNEWIKEGDIDSWEYWGGKFCAITPSENNIKDNRYIPKAIESHSNGSELLTIHSLAILLIQLLSHDTSFPWLWSAENGNAEWNMLLLSKLNYTPVSSYTMNILQACLWDKNRETNFWIKDNRVSVEGYPDFDRRDDSLNDPPIIDDLKKMIRYLSKTIKNLEHSQLSLGINKPRQLTPISLIQLSKSSPTYNIVEDNAVEYDNDRE